MSELAPKYAVVMPMALDRQRGAPTRWGEGGEGKRPQLIRTQRRKKWGKGSTGEGKHAKTQQTAKRSGALTRGQVRHWQQGEGVPQGNAPAQIGVLNRCHSIAGLAVVTAEIPAERIEMRKLPGIEHPCKQPRSGIQRAPRTSRPAHQRRNSADHGAYEKRLEDAVLEAL